MFNRSSIRTDLQPKFMLMTTLFSNPCFYFSLGMTRFHLFIHLKFDILRPSLH